MNEYERYLFDLRGFLLLEQVLSAAEVAELNEQIDRQGLSPPAESIESQRFGDFLEWHEAFQRLIDQPRVLPYLKEILGDGLRLDHAYGIKMRPGTDGLRLHGGATPYDPPEFYHFQDGRIYTGLTVVTYALTDCPPGGGGFCCVPGSHKANYPCPDDVKRYQRDIGCVVQVPMRAGDVVIFTEALTHGTLRWNAPHDRRSLLYKYSPGHSSWGPANWPASLLERVTPERRLFLEPAYVYKRKGVGQAY